jgi:hypothetical protein
VPDAAGDLGVPAGVALVDDPAAADFLLGSPRPNPGGKRLGAPPAVGVDTVAWLAYPKRSKAAGATSTATPSGRSCDTRHALVANVAIDNTWSALRMKVER